MQAKTTLKDLGLSKQESEVYLALLKSGGTGASALAKIIGIKRTTVYAQLNELAKKGFATILTKKSKQIYHAEKPKHVAKYFEHKLEAFNALVPTLEAMANQRAENEGWCFIKTAEELKRFYLGILEEYKNREYYIICGGCNHENTDPEFFAAFKKQRAKNKIKVKQVLSPHLKKEEMNLFPSNCETKFLPGDNQFNATIDIFKDKILIFSPQLNAVALVIAMEAMIDVFNTAFKMLWGYLGQEQ